MNVRNTCTAETMLHWSLPLASTSNSPHHESDSDSDATIYSPEKTEQQQQQREHHIKNNSSNGLAHEDKCKNVNILEQDKAGIFTQNINAEDCNRNQWSTNICSAVEPKNGNICVPESAAQENISNNLEGNLWQSHTNMSDVGTILLDTQTEPTNMWSILEEDFTDFQWYTMTEDCLLGSEKYGSFPLDEEMFGIKNNIPGTHIKITDGTVVKKDFATDEPENSTALSVDNPLDNIIASMENMSFHVDACDAKPFATQAEMPAEKISQDKQRVSRKRKRSLTRSSPQQKSAKLTGQSKHVSTASICTRLLHLRYYVKDMLCGITSPMCTTTAETLYKEVAATLDLLLASDVHTTKTRNGKKQREAIQVAETLLHQLNVFASDPGSALPWTSQGCRSPQPHQVFSESKGWQPPNKSKRGRGRPCSQYNHSKLEASIHHETKKISSYRRCGHSQIKSDQKGRSTARELYVHGHSAVAHPLICCDSNAAGIQRKVKKKENPQRNNAKNIIKQSDSRPYSDRSVYHPDHDCTSTIPQAQHTEQNMNDRVKILTHNLNANQVNEAKNMKNPNNSLTNSIPDTQQTCFDEGIIIADRDERQFEKINNQDGNNFCASEHNLQTVGNFPQETGHRTFVTSSEPLCCTKKYVLMELQENGETTSPEELQSYSDNTYFSQAHKNIQVFKEHHNGDSILQTLCKTVPDFFLLDMKNHKDAIGATDIVVGEASHPKHTDCENAASESLLSKFNQTTSNESMQISSRDATSKIQGINLQLKSIALPIASEMFDASHLPLSFWNDPYGSIPEDWIEDLEWKE